MKSGGGGGGGGGCGKAIERAKAKTKEQNIFFVVKKVVCPRSH